jgi:hypothetical protein
MMQTYLTLNGNADDAVPIAIGIYDFHGFLLIDFIMSSNINENYLGFIFKIKYYP